MCEDEKRFKPRVHRDVESSAVRDWLYTNPDSWVRGVISSRTVTVFQILAITNSGDFGNL